MFLDNKPADQAGFTLLEVIIAMAIMVISFATILAVESNSINASIRAKNISIVAMLAKNKMIDMEYEIEGKTFDEVKKESAGAFDPPYENFRWTSAVKEVKFPNLNTGGGGAQGSQGDGGGDMAQMLTKLITNFLSKAIREVTVTIFWKKDGGEQSFSVSTYWVDLNHEFALSE